MISVCLTTYNGENYIIEQLESILHQLSEMDEVIVSDDGSTDNTLAIIENLQDKRIVILKHERAGGVVSNMENALKHARGNIIFLADQDDVWLPEKVERSLVALRDAQLVISDCYVTDGELNVIHDSFFKKNSSNRNKFIALIKNPYLGCCMAFNKSLLDIALPFPKDIPMHDIWLGNVAAFKKSVLFIPDKLIYYRRHDMNVSTASEPSTNSLLTKINFRISVLKNLLKIKPR